MVCQTCNKEFVAQSKNAIYCCRSCYYIAHHKAKEKADDEFIPALQQADKLTNGFFLSRIVYEEIRKQHHLPCYGMINKKFHKWEDALSAANIIPYPSPERPRKSSSIKNTLPYTIENVKIDILRVRDIVQQTPTVIQYRQYGLFEWNLASRTLVGRDGAWAATCLACDLRPHTRTEGSGNGTISRYTTPSGMNVNMQSSYEVRFADRLTFWNEDWLCHQELPDGITFHGANQKPAKYRPDFFLPLRDIYFDTKGWFRNQDKSKIALVRKHNPDLEVYLVFKKQLTLAEVMSSFDEWFTLCTENQLFG